MNRSLIAKIVARTIGSLAGLLGIGSLFFTLLVLESHHSMIQRGPLTILFTVFFAVFSLAVDAYFIYAAYLVWFTYSPLAVRHICGLLGFGALIPVTKLVVPSMRADSPWAPCVFFAGLAGVYFAYRAASERLSRFLFPDITRGARHEDPAASQSMTRRDSE